MTARAAVRPAILGLAVADALGVPAEFHFRETLRQHPITGMVGFGAHDVPKGSWSDDTSMTLCTLHSIAERGRIDPDHIMLAFTRWVEEGYMTPGGTVFDIGRTCLRAIGSYNRGKPADACGERGELSNGNGSLMRILPVCLFNSIRGLSDREAIENVHLVSALTHAHERSLVACGIYDFLVRALIAHPAPETIGAALYKAEQHYSGFREISAYKRLLSPDFAHLPLSEIKSSGYVVDTLEAAVWCLLTTGSYRDCVLKAVNLGQDTDTVAAVAGGLAGILYGFDAIPREWLEDLIKGDEIAALCDRFANSI